MIYEAARCQTLQRLGELVPPLTRCYTDDRSFWLNKEG